MPSCEVLLAGMGAWLWGAPPPAPGTRLVWAVWLGAAVVTAGLLVMAPGNWQRLALADPDAAGRYHRWVLLAPRTLLTAARMAARPPACGAVLVLAAAVLQTASAPRRPRPNRREIGLALGGYLLLNCVGVAFLKAAFMRDMWVEAMPGRVVSVLVLQLLISSAGLALWARDWLPVRPAWSRHRAVTPVLAALTVLLLLTGQARPAGLELIFTAPAYSAQMQARYEVLASASHRQEAEAVLPPLRLERAQGLLVPIPSARQRADVHVELAEDAGQKNNRFLAQYYGIPRVRLSEAPPQAP